ncbi:MAG: alpha/beta fold hydrolase [Woeseiaceae bacterium]|nr:alpha/beta fold hydrolase [Woeseiaceae bacterium]NIP21106.1 alpha/beta fold hydrolase [Woeseiaceae bacterium]NIS90078.1 alpha/beta fold hydrolase [Woeseiaceae bacterium]
MIAALLILLVILAGWFYWFYFMSTDAAIRHAEAFLFRRMTVSQTDVDGEYRHFFVTNRVIAGIETPVEERATSDRSETLTVGTFDASIRPSLGLGMIINATDWFQNEEIRLSAAQALTEQQFIDELRAVVNESPNRSLLVVIHGFRERFASALRKTAFIASVLDIDTPVLVFDWPGDQGSSLRGYRAARSVAQQSGAEFAAALKLIVATIQPDNLSIVANSMGAEVVAQAFSQLYEDPTWADEGRELNHVILTAPDVDHAEFNERFRHEIRAFASDLIVYVSSNDRALLVSRLINREKRAGESTLSPDMLDEAIMISDIMEPDDELITLVDVTPVNRTRNFHNFSLETPEYYDDLFLRLTSEDRAPQSRLLYRIRTPEDTEYWVLTGGR